MCIECDIPPERCGGDHDPESVDKDEYCVYEADEHNPNAYEDDQLVDSNGRDYNPWSGSVTPSVGRCNASLANWDERYPEKRYCMRYPESHYNRRDNSDFCRNHKHHEERMKRAHELMEHGLYSKSIAHTFDKLDPVEKIVSLGIYDSLVNDSTYDFEESTETYKIDFSDHDEELPIEIETELDEDEKLAIGVPVPTSKANRAFALWHAAIDEIKQLKINEKLVDEGAERETVVSVTDDGREITDMEEHHLNLPYSRLVKDHKEHLEYGGVTMGDTEPSTSVPISTDELVMDLSDENPNEFTDETKNNPLFDSG